MSMDSWARQADTRQCSCIRILLFLIVLSAPLLRPALRFHDPDVRLSSDTRCLTVSPAPSWRFVQRAPCRGPDRAGRSCRVDGRIDTLAKRRSRGTR